MPHLVILYTGQLDAEVNMTTLCRELADAMLTVKDEADKQVFPTGGTRVLAYPAPHFAVADGGRRGWPRRNLTRTPRAQVTMPLFTLIFGWAKAAPKPRSSVQAKLWLMRRKLFLPPSWRNATLASRCKSM
jgi:hypothetical protein